MAAQLLADVVGPEEPAGPGWAQREPAAAPMPEAAGHPVQHQQHQQPGPVGAGPLDLRGRVRRLVRWSLRLALRVGAAEGPLSLRLGNLFDNRSPVYIE
ncbi:hypothetical protein GPECTOR_2g1053 [Gonium pectorale]|uniref:Uncharacterized protein n=1 Tax=Gonium pectorale TaxID=33097 RepID=A0A150H0E8_GONPE|nr:hypothetical protein GPECTOR_2g1053 [Gonium pectorale]|eukprot:KXZ55504.1 hypothetical protein GPECTOR_2g1053 [Gonium pectorale]